MKTSKQQASALRDASISSKPEPGADNNEKAANPCPASFLIHPWARDTIIVDNSITPCTPLIATGGVRTLVANNIVVECPPVRWLFRKR